MKNNMYKMVCRFLDGIYWQTVLLAIKGRWFDVWSWCCWVMTLGKFVHFLFSTCCLDSICRAALESVTSRLKTCLFDLPYSIRQ